MNILFTSDLAGMGGGETSLLNLSKVLVCAHNLFLICAVEGELPNRLRALGIRCYILNYRDKKRLPNTLLQIRKIIKGNNIEIIHSNDPLTSIIFYFATLGLNVSNYWTCHGQWYQFNLLKRKLISISNEHIFCVSTSVLNSLKNMDFKRLSLSYLGIPIQEYINVEKSNLRDEFDILPADTLIAVIGRFQKIKGQLKAAEAINMLIKEGYNIKCLFIGGCVYNNDEEKDYHKAVVDYINSNNLNDYFIFAGERKNIPNILKEIDLVVIPSDNESFGMVAIEAMATLTPILSTPNDGVSEILEHRPDMIANTNDAKGIYFLTKSYLDNPSHEEIIEFEKRRCNEFEIKNIAQNYLSYFKAKI